MRRSWGEFYDPNQNAEVAVREARHRFLLWADREFQVTADLKKIVFPVFLHSGFSLSAPDVVEAIARWSRLFRFSEDWILQQARETLLTWQLVPKFAESDPPGWPPQFSFIYVPKNPTEPFRFEPYWSPDDDLPEAVRALHFSILEPRAVGWDLRLQRRGQFETEIRQMFESHLKSYCDRLEALAQAQGLKRSPVPRARGVPKEHREGGAKTGRRHDPADQFLDFRWLVFWRCGDKTYDEIADLHQQATGQTIGAEAVGSAVRDLARFIGLKTNFGRRK